MQKLSTRKLIMGISGLAVLFIVLVQAHKFPVQRFCKDMSEGHSIDEVVRIAQERNLLVPDEVDRHAEKLIIYNNNWPVFRYGCQFTFSWRKVLTSELIVVNSVAGF